MRASVTCLIVLVSTFVQASSPDYSPFFSPFFENAFSSSQNILRHLQKRQSSCPAGTNACTNLGQPDACCSTDTVCSADAANNVACCPTGAACTGSLVGETGAATSTGTGTETSAGAFVFGSTTATDSPTTTTTSQATITGGGSTVANAYFPFVYIPTSYSNAAQCTSYYSSCQSEYASCTASLGGNVNGVTVSGGGAGITVQGATATAAASSICSSLSSKACYGLQLPDCSAFGTTGATAGTFINPNAAAPTRHPGGLYGVGIGIAVGLAGQMVR